MNGYLKILIFSVLAVFLMAGNSFATNITIYDGSSANYGWYKGVNQGDEDQEVETNSASGQVWDLEGFFIIEDTLAMVGGYNFINQGGYQSGDLFIDVDGDAVYGEDALEIPNPDKLNVYGYDYVVNFFISPNSTEIGAYQNGGNIWNYDVYAIDDTTKIDMVKYAVNYESNPWQVSAGQDLMWLFNGNARYFTGLSDADVGFLGDVDGIPSHYGIIFDGLNDLVDAGYLYHYTYQCGNDNLIGRIPEPTQMLLLGTALLGLAGIGRKKFFKK